LKPKEFTEKYYPFALQTQNESGISSISILAQAALESGWGEHAPGNAFFGVKDTDGVNGNEQLITTTEYSRRFDLKFPEILSITPCTIGGVPYFKYIVKDYFRKYETPGQCFADHAKFFIRNPRYHSAMMVCTDPYRFIDEIAKAGYASAPGYAAMLKKIAKMIEINIV